MLFLRAIVWTFPCDILGLGKLLIAVFVFRVIFSFFRSLLSPRCFLSFFSLLSFFLVLGLVFTLISLPFLVLGLLLHLIFGLHLLGVAFIPLVLLFLLLFDWVSVAVKADFFENAVIVRRKKLTCQRKLSREAEVASPVSSRASRRESLQTWPTPFWTWDLKFGLSTGQRASPSLI